MSVTKELTKLWNKGKFVNTNNALHNIAKNAQELWTDLVSNSSAPSWWGRMAVLDATGGGGGFLIKEKKIGSYRVYYANKGAYNYLAVIQKGRGRFDMKPGLLNSSKARHGKNGRYLIIPFGKNENGSNVSPKNNSIASVLKKTGSQKEKSINDTSKNVVRNKYKTRKDPGMTGKGNVHASEQKYKNGNIQRSATKFVILSEKSKGWFYPKINAQPFDKMVKKYVQKSLKSKELKKAIASDTKYHLIKLLVKQANQQKKP